MLPPDLHASRLDERLGSKSPVDVSRVLKHLISQFLFSLFAS